MHQSESFQENEIHIIFWDFKIQMYLKILARIPDLVLVNKKKRNLVDFAVPVDHIVKKEIEKIEKYLDLDQEQKSLWNMKVTVIPIIVGTLGMVFKSLGKRLGKLERIKTVQTKALLRLAGILEI